MSDESGTVEDLFEEEKEKKKKFEVTHIIKKESLGEEEESFKAKYLAVASAEFEKQKEKLLDEAESLGLDTSMIEEQLVDPSALESAKAIIASAKRQRSGSGEAVGYVTREPMKTGMEHDSYEDAISHAVKLAQSHKAEEKKQGNQMIDKLLQSMLKNKNVRTGKQIVELLKRETTYICGNCGEPVFGEGSVCKKCGFHMER